MPIIKLFGPPDPQYSKIIGTADVVNMLPAVSGDGRLAWVQRPGLTPVSISGWPAGNLRGWITAGKYLFAVVGRDFVIVDDTWALARYPDVLSTTDGLCYMAYNLFSVCITDGDNGYVFNSDEADPFSVIGANDFATLNSFPGGKGMAFLNGFLLSGGNGTEDYDQIRCYASKVYRSSEWNYTNFGAVESNPDDLLRVDAVKDAAVMYGAETTEVWNYNADGTGFPFSYLPGTAINYGLAAIQSVASFKGSKVALMRSGNNVLPGIIDGYNLLPLTKDYPAIQSEWSRYSKVDDAIACSYTMMGIPIYQITFPTEQVTWAHDGNSGSWVRFESNDGPFIGLHAINFNGEVLFSTREGSLYKLDDSKAADDTTPVKVSLTSNPFRGYSGYSSVNRITLDAEVGNTPMLPLSDEYEPRLNIAISADGGYTYRPQKTVSLGAQGEYKTRVTARRFGGRIKNLAVRLTGTSKVVRYVIQSEVEAEIENDQNTAIPE